MFPAIQPHAQFNINNGSLTPCLINNDDIAGRIKNVFNTASMPAAVTSHLPKSIKRDIINNDIKIKEGSLIISDDIIYAKQYAINRVKRNNDSDLSCPIKQGRFITTIPESKIILDETILDKAIEDNTSINKQDESNRTALMVAVLKPNNTKEVERLIEKDAELNFIDKEFNTALWLAIKNKKKGITNVLLKAKPKNVAVVDVNIAGAGALTPLMLAVIYQDVKLINTLASKKAQDNAANDDKYSAFTLAINNNASSLVFDALIDLGANVTFSINGGLPPLLLAAAYENIMVLDKILAQKVDIDTPDDKGWTALMRAVPCRHYDMMQYLVNHGANVSYRSPQNITALYIAATRGDTRALNILHNDVPGSLSKAIPDGQANLEPHTTDPKKTLKESEHHPDSGKPNTTAAERAAATNDMEASTVPASPITAKPAVSGAKGFRHNWLPTTIAPTLMAIYSATRQFIAR